MNLTSIAALAGAIAIATVAWLYMAQSYPPAIDSAGNCDSLPDGIVLVGRAVTIAEAEGISLTELATAPPTVPRIPFGHSNPEWVELKAVSKPGDTVQAYRTEVSGGHLLLRGNCLVGKLPGWIR